MRTQAHRIACLSTRRLAAASSSDDGWPFLYSVTVLVLCRWLRRCRTPPRSARTCWASSTVALHASDGGAAPQPPRVGTRALHPPAAASLECCSRPAAFAESTRHKSWIIINKIYTVLRSTPRAWIYCRGLMRPAFARPRALAAHLSQSPVHLPWNPHQTDTRSRAVRTHASPLRPTIRQYLPSQPISVGKRLPL
jgi:hypothetical protein